MKPYKTIYHIFDWYDESTDYFTSSWKEALKYYNDLKKKGYDRVRLYKDFYNTKEDYEDDINCEELLIYAYGE